MNAVRFSAGATRRLPRAAVAPQLGLCLLLCLLVGLARAGGARAVILPAQTLDGPSEDIVGFGGAALAEDGTGGVAYLKRVGGVAHVFAASYANGTWQAPARVDYKEPFAASWVRIGAAEGGELIVVWATPFATEHGHSVYELLGAELAPGSHTFGQAVIIDPNIGEAAGTSPDLAVSSTGQADVVYRDIDFSETVPLLRPSDVVESVRVASFTGERWTSLGAVNRDPGLSMRAPTEVNAPQIALGPTGNGIVVWQEPEASGVARIWARRVFGQTLSYVMPVTATAVGGTPINNDADAPSVAITKLGQAEVAYRQPWTVGSPLAGPRIFLNTLSDGESERGAEFSGAISVDPTLAGGHTASVGRPSVDANERREARVLYDGNGQPRVIERSDKGELAVSALGTPFSGSLFGAADALASAAVVTPEGGGVMAWPSSDPQGRPGVGVREDFPSGAVQTALLSGGAGGPIGELAVGRSGLGDGIIAFQQGPTGDAAIVVAEATAPPEPFAVTVPKTWVKPSALSVAWAQGESANGPLAYQVVLDGKSIGSSQQGRGYRFAHGTLSTGTHDIQILARDIFGQEILTPRTAVKVDGSAPAVRLSRRGRSLLVQVSDRGSGLLAGSVQVSFGDGAHAAKHRSAAHRYTRGGKFTVYVTARDKAGNKAFFKRKVTV
ncbi:MAG TPA: PKD domain-containing protein [Solirubrobacteraceae bacterium]|nr:PKD domain-containing protein [Solirubrobacteraceae bacterium]